MIRRPLALRLVVILALLIAVFGFGLAARLLAGIEAEPRARIGLVPLVLTPFVALPILHSL